MSYEDIESPGNPIYKCNFDKWPDKYVSKKKQENNKYFDKKQLQKENDNFGENIRITNTFNKMNLNKYSLNNNNKPMRVNSMDNIKQIKIIFRNLQLGSPYEIKAYTYETIGSVIQKYINKVGYNSYKFEYNCKEIKDFNLSVEKIGINDGQSIFVTKA